MTRNLIIRRHAAIFVVMIVVLVAGAVIMYIAGLNAVAAQVAVTQQRLIGKALVTVLSAVKDAETGQRGYIMLGEEAYLEPYRSAVAELPGQITALEALAGARGLNASDVAEIRRLVDDRMAALGNSIELRKREGRQAAEDVVRSGLGKLIMNDLRDLENRVRVAEDVETRAFEAAADHASVVRTGVVITVTLATLAFLVWAARRLAAAAAETEREKTKLDVTLRSIGDAVITTDAQGRITMMNPVAESLTGWTQGGASGRPLVEVFNIVNEETRALVESPVAKALREGAIVGLANHTILIAKDGTEVHIDDSAAPIRSAGEGGMVVGVVMVFRDIGERREMERQTELSEVRYRRLFEAALDGILLLDPTTRKITDANPFMEELLEKPRADIIGKELFEIGLIRDEEENKRAFKQITQGEVVRYENTPIETASGAKREVEIVANLYQEDHHSVVQANVRDISERAEQQKALKVIAERLRESEERFRAIADNIPQLAWMVDAGSDGKASWFNKSWLDYTGTTLEENRGSGWKAVHHPGHLEAVAAKFEQHVRENRHWEDTFPLRGKGGHYRWFLSRMKVIRDETGKAVRIFGTNTDITEQRDAAEKLRASEAKEREARLEAERANRAKDNFLATLSHELRTPLNAVLGWAVILRTSKPADGTPMHPDVDHGLAVIERNARMQAKLIEDVLDVASVTSGKFILDMRPLELTGLVYAAADAVRPTAADKGLTLRVAGAAGAEGGGGGAPEALWVSGDAGRLTQAVTNLLTNAVKFTPRGGSVTVRIERVKDFSSGSGGSIARVVVTDTGKGIDAAFLPHAFDRFKQAGEGITRSYGGMGLGLSVVRHIIEAHGGTAQAVSEGEGKGATFTLELPTVPPTAAAPSADTLPPAHVPRLDGVRVLVVDDEEDARMMVATVLEKAGAQVLLAASAEEGHRQAVKAGESAQMPHVMVSDIGMPGEDGYSMMRRVREARAGKDLPAVAVTAFAAPEDKRRALVAGFQAHIAKPLDPHELVATVAGLVGKIAP